jgi:hypothetical protein
MGNKKDKEPGNPSLLRRARNKRKAMRLAKGLAALGKPKS